MSTENLYDILGIPPSADEIEIRRAYFEKAKLHHPDRNPTKQQEFELVKRAYDELLDPIKRASHDKEIGIQHNFGNSQLAQDFQNYNLNVADSLGFKGKSKTGFWARLVGVLRAIFYRKSKLTHKPATLSASIVRENSIDDFTNENKLSLAIYSEDSFPLGQGESMTLNIPDDQESVKECSELLSKSFSQYPALSRAVLIEASLAAMPSEKVFIVLIEKQVSQSWGIDSLQSVQVDNYPEHLPGLLLCSASEGPFAEAVNLYGLEFYSSTLQNTLIN